MTTAHARYRRWAEHPYFDLDTRQELAAIAHDPHEIEERFHSSLAFGTAGLRGIIGAGTNRMNRYVVRQASWGLADYISARGGNDGARGVVIAHDSRRCSSEFAREAALTLNAAGVAAYLWDDLRPTPMLSFAVRRLGAIAGIVITASHNPGAYNGFKVYWETGGQISPERAAAIEACIEAFEDLTMIHPMAEAEAQAVGLLRRVPPEVDQAYYDAVTALAVTDPVNRAGCRILFTPLHGAGNQPVRQALGMAGFAVEVVREQAEPDPAFPTIAAPNPEDPSVFTLALRQAAHTVPDVIIATDADADRLGALAPDPGGQYRTLTGNQIGTLLVHYLIASRPLPPAPVVVKSIATSNLVVPLCREHGVAVRETHTGFKFIGDLIRELERTGSHTFLFGFEESYGYLGATFVRDKDAVMAALLVADAVAFYKARNQTLYAALMEIWQRYGCFLEVLHHVALPGRAGQERIDTIMEGLRQSPPVALGGIPIAFADDYAAGEGENRTTCSNYPLTLGRANVLHYRFSDGGFVMVRPSGTEPKLKVYFSVTGRSEEEAGERLRAVRQDTLGHMGLPVQ